MNEWLLRPENNPFALLVNMLTVCPHRWLTSFSITFLRLRFRTTSLLSALKAGNSAGLLGLRRCHQSSTIIWASQSLHWGWGDHL